MKIFKICVVALIVIIITASMAFANQYDIFDVESANKVNYYDENARVETMDTVIFGSYPQSDTSGKRKDPIEWIVVEDYGDSALLLSKYILDCKCYNDTNDYVSWENCTLRSWLNMTFYDKAFNSTEKNVIMTVPMSTPDYKWNPNDGSIYTGYGNSLRNGKTTRDKVFCLNLDEYLGNFLYDVNEEYNCNAMTSGTEYAKKNGLDDFYDWGQSGYWLRNCYQYDTRQNTDLTYATVGGNLYYASKVNHKGVGVRPAIWVSYPLINQFYNQIEETSSETIEETIEYSEPNQYETQSNIIEYSEPMLVETQPSINEIYETTLKETTTSNNVVIEESTSFAKSHPKYSEKLGSLVIEERVYDSRGVDASKLDVPTDTPLGKYYSVNYVGAIMREQPSDDAKEIIKLAIGDSVRVDKITDGWAYILYNNYIEGYVKIDYLLLGDSYKTDGDIVLNKKIDETIYREFEVTDFTQDPIYNLEDVVTSGVDFDSIYVTENNGSYCLAVRLNEREANKLKELTKKNKGKFINVLCKGYRNTLHYSYIIKKEIKDGIVLLYTDAIVRSKSDSLLYARADLRWIVRENYGKSKIDMLIVAGDFKYPKKKEIFCYRGEVTDLCENIKKIEVVYKKGGIFSDSMSNKYYVEITYTSLPKSVEEKDLQKYSSSHDNMYNIISSIETEPQKKRLRLYTLDTETAEKIAEKIKSGTYILRLR